MPTLTEAVDDFLAQKRIAVVGVSRSSGEAANSVYRALREGGHEVFAVNPNAEEVEGDTCYENLKSIPEGVQAVMIATTPAVAKAVVRECAEQGISRVWMHRSFGKGSASQGAAATTASRSSPAAVPGCSSRERISAISACAWC
jgi:predicted CoA-binding protein